MLITSRAAALYTNPMLWLCDQGGKGQWQSIAVVQQPLPQPSFHIGLSSKKASLLVNTERSGEEDDFGRLL